MEGHVKLMADVAGIPLLLVRQDCLGLTSIRTLISPFVGWVHDEVRPVRRCYLPSVLFKEAWPLRRNKGEPAVTGTRPKVLLSAQGGELSACGQKRLHDLTVWATVGRPESRTTTPVSLRAWGAGRGSRALGSYRYMLGAPGCRLPPLGGREGGLLALWFPHVARPFASRCCRW